MQTKLGCKDFEKKAKANPHTADISQKINETRPAKVKTGEAMEKSKKEQEREAHLAIYRMTMAQKKIEQKATIEKEKKAFRQELIKHKAIREKEESIKRLRILEREKAILNAIDTSIIKHSHILHLKRRKTLFINEYGIPKGEKNWNREILNFLKDILFQIGATLEEVELSEMIARVNNHLDTNPHLNQIQAEIGGMSGTDFEMHCAQILENAGWNVIRNGKTGDQGVDLIASKNTRRIAIQCKRYSGTVGNKAVQEISAGMRHEGCDIAIVVSNAPYTASAIALARSNDVLLLDTASLCELDNWLT